MSTAYAYGRVSHKDQIAKGESIPGQEERSLAYFNFQLAPKGVEWGGFHSDPRNVSAFRKPFARRVAGKRLMGLLQPGDHLIFDKLDRMWRSVDDFCVMRKWFERRQINVHVVNYLGASFSWFSPAGRFFLTTFVAMAEFSSAETSDRIRRAKRRMREAGRFQGGRVPIGCKVIGKSKETRRLVWDEGLIEQLREVDDLVTGQGYSLRQAAILLEQRLCAAEGRNYTNSAFAKAYWTRDKIREMVDRAKIILPLYPDTDPNTLEWQVIQGTRRKPVDMLMNLE
jgi:putative DNA-invertase from lambdoid prophage Rac